MENYVGNEEDRYRIEITSSRGVLEYFDFTESVENNIYEEKEWSLNFLIRVFVEEGQEVAIIKGTLFDENKLEECGLDIVEAADYIAQDENSASYWLSQFEGYRDDGGDEWIWEDSYSGYIATFYVYEEYRHKGIAKYLFSNIHKLLKYSLNISVRCLCIYPQPQNPVTWKNISDDEMMKTIIQVIERNGFVKIGNEGFYAKSYDLAEL